MTASRPARALYYGAPMLFALWLHWLALKTWFSGDDFAWLGLRSQIHSFSDLLWALFHPFAQGTVRLWSERVYFLVLTSLFGLNALAFRIAAFTTQFLNLLLLQWIARRLTGSVLAALLAPALWLINPAMIIPMAWDSAYNEILCSTFLLAAFALLLKYVETGERRYWVAQFAVFVLGFGALELMVMYAAIASLYAYCCARSIFRRTLWLFVPSGLFTLVHYLWIPKAPDPHYAMHPDASMLLTLWNYWRLALGASRPDIVDWRPFWLGTAIALLLTAALVAFAWRRSERWFPIAWFVLMLLPVLPLRDHFSDYYLTTPVIGLAIVGAWAVSAGARRPWTWILLALYLTVSFQDLHIAERWYYEHARNLRNVVLGLVRAHPGDKTVLLTNVSNDLFWSGFGDHPFPLFGLEHVYLAPGTEKAIDPHPEWGGINEYVLPQEQAGAELATNHAAVFSVSAGGVQNVTAQYKTMLDARFFAEHRTRIEIGNPLFAFLLGPAWYSPENGFRWMPRTATVRIGGPQSPGERLAISGYAPRAVVPTGLSVDVDGRRLGTRRLVRPDERFEVEFPLPASEVGAFAMDVQLTVDHTIQAGTDRRPLGLIVQTVTIKK